MLSQQQKLLSGCGGRGRSRGRIFTFTVCARPPPHFLSLYRTYPLRLPAILQTRSRSRYKADKLRGLRCVGAPPKATIGWRPAGHGQQCSLCATNGCAPRRATVLYSRPRYVLTGSHELHSFYHPLRSARHVSGSHFHHTYFPHPPIPPKTGASNPRQHPCL